jgi:hypothetical protein
MESKYLVIKEMTTGYVGVTKVFGVFSKSSGVLLGTIKWYGPWRAYAFHPEGGTVWSPDCLECVKERIINLMEDRKAKGQ